MRGIARAEVVALDGARETLALRHPREVHGLARFEQAQAGLSSALSRLLVVVERYPELKANQNFRDLQAQLEGTENRISVERMRFNERAQEFNTARLRFPAVLFAGSLGFKEKAYFKAQAGAERAPQVQFNFGASPATGAAGAPGPASPRP